MKISIRSFLVFVLTLGQLHFAVAQTASLLPNAVQQFFDSNGNPLTSGTITTYIPNTLTKNTTWQDPSQAVTWPNPLTLNAAGRPPNNKGIFGQGDYRQVVKDRNGNLIWDQFTSSTGSGGGGGGGIGDGNAVGTILPWSGIVVPTSYLFAYGQEVLRSSYPALLTTITLTQNVTCTNTSAILTSVADTSQISAGTKVEAACLPPSTTVVSVTSNTITLNNAANINSTLAAQFFPWGNGNGSTTANIPDLRGNVLAGRDNMGGTPAGYLTSVFCTFPGMNARCGGQSQTLTALQLPIITPAGIINITDPGHPHSLTGIRGNASGSGGGNIPGSDNTTAGSGVIPNNSAITNVTGLNSSNVVFAGTPFGHGDAHPNVQPTIELNYIIKVLPDINGSSNFQLSGDVSTPLNSFVTTINPHVVSNTNLAQVNGPALKGVATSGLNDVSDIIIASLTALTVPDAINDYLIVWDHTSGSYKKINPGTIASSATSGVSSFGGLTGAIICGTGISCVAGTVSALLPNLSANSILGNATAGGAPGISLAMPSCSNSTNGLTWITSVGFGCNSISGASQWTTTGSDIYYTTGKVGVGTSAPASPFVTQFANSSNSFNDLSSLSIINSNSTANNTASVRFSDGTATRTEVGSVFTRNGTNSSNLNLRTTGTSGLAARIILDQNANRMPDYGQGAAVFSTNGTVFSNTAVYAVAYGMVCDGVTNNTTPLINAINAAVNLVYATVILPAGNCKFNTGVSVNMFNSLGLSIQGQGMGATTLFFATGGLVLTTSTNGTNPFTISGMRLLSGVAGTYNCLTINGGANPGDINTNIVLREIECGNYAGNTGWWATGLVFADTSNVTISDYYFVGTTASRTAFGIIFQGNTAPTSIIKIRGGIISWADVGIYVIGGHSEGWNLVQMDINAVNTGFFFNTYPTNTVLNGQCTLTGNQISAFDIGIRINGCQAGAISGNTLLITNSGGADSGIYLENSYTMTTFGNIIYGNGSIPGILIGGGATNTVSTGNACNATTSC